MTSKPIQMFEEKELKAKLALATQVLKKTGRVFLPIRGFEAAKGLTIVEMNDDALDHFADLATAETRAFYVWDEAHQAGAHVDDGVTTGLRLYLHDGKVLYAWNFLTENALLREGDGDDDVNRFGRPLPKLTPAQEKLLKRLQKDRDGIIEDLVKVSLQHTNAKDLTLASYKVAQIGETELGIRDIPYEYDVRSHEITQDARARIEEALAKRREDAVKALVAAFPDWFSKKGNPRMNKPLVKMFIEEQGYKFANGFIDDVKVRLDVVLATA